MSGYSDRSVPGTRTSSTLDPTTARRALRNLVDGGHEDIAVILGLLTERQADMVRRLRQPAATPPDRAGCADCARTADQQRGCGTCWARTWRTRREVGAE